MCAGLVIAAPSLGAFAFLPARAPVDDDAPAPVLNLSALAIPPAPLVKTKGATAAPASLGHAAPVTSAALQNWRRRLIALIERHKPVSPSARGHSGTVRILFRRDQAAYNLLQSAKPLPAPPPGLRAAELTCVLPIRYPPCG